ncbi:6302_t:CDS:1, partial [Racocetra fulgida]
DTLFAKCANLLILSSKLPKETLDEKSIPPGQSETLISSSFENSLFKKRSVLRIPSIHTAEYTELNPP